MLNASLACILGVLLHRDHQYVPKGVREVQFTLSATKFSEIYVKRCQMWPTVYSIGLFCIIMHTVLLVYFITVYCFQLQFVICFYSFDE